MLEDVGQWWSLTGEFESVEHVGHTVGEHDRGAIADLEMQVGAARGAGAAHIGDMVSALDPFTRAHPTMLSLCRWA